MRRECAAFKTRIGLLQGDDQPFRMRGRIEPTVCQIFGFACEIELSYQTIEPPLNRHVNVRRPDVTFWRRIGTGLDGTKTVASRRIRREARKAFEIGIDRRPVGVTRVPIFARSIRLPDIDARLRHRCAPTGEHATADVDELALCLGGAAAWA